jgi:hypothetical protein
MLICNKIIGKIGHRVTVSEEGQAAAPELVVLMFAMIIVISFGMWAMALVASQTNAYNAAQSLGSVIQETGVPPGGAGGISYADLGNQTSLVQQSYQGLTYKGLPQANQLEALGCRGELSAPGAFQRGILTAGQFWILSLQCVPNSFVTNLFPDGNSIVNTNNPINIKYSVPIEPYRNTINSSS